MLEVFIPDDLLRTFHPFFVRVPDQCHNLPELEPFRAAVLQALFLLAFVAIFVVLIILSL